MEETYIDMNHELTLDANAVAGLLQEIFGTEMTTVPSECAGCGNQAEVGSLLAYVHSPGLYTQMLSLQAGGLAYR